MTLSASMYTGDEFVKSELMSSYAWDTALNFICQNNTNGYLLATTTSSEYGNLGTDNGELTGTYDKDSYSKIHDFLGNFSEWTTEYHTNTGFACVARGGRSSEYYAARRGHYSSVTAIYGFRIQLYILDKE